MYIFLFILVFTPSPLPHLLKSFQQITYLIIFSSSFFFEKYYQLLSYTRRLSVRLSRRPSVVRVNDVLSR